MQNWRKSFDDTYASAVLNFAAAGKYGDTQHIYPAIYDGVSSGTGIILTRNYASFLRHFMEHHSLYSHTS